MLSGWSSGSVVWLESRNMVFSVFIFRVCLFIIMTASSPSIDIERAVDELSERLFQKPKGTVFLSVVCGRMPFLFWWRCSIPSINGCSVHIQNAPLHIHVHHHGLVFALFLSRNCYPSSVSYGSAIVPSSFSGSRWPYLQLTFVSCHMCSIMSRVTRSHNHLHRRTLASVRSATVTWMKEAFTATCVESVWWWLVLHDSLTCSMIIIVCGSTIVLVLVISEYSFTILIILVLYTLSFLHFCVHDHLWRHRSSLRYRGATRRCCHLRVILVLGSHPWRHRVSTPPWCFHWVSIPAYLDYRVFKFV